MLIWSYKNSVVIYGSGSPIFKGAGEFVYLEYHKGADAIEVDDLLPFCQGLVRWSMRELDQRDIDERIYDNELYSNMNRGGGLEFGFTEVRTSDHSFSIDMFLPETALKEIGEQFSIYNNSSSPRHILIKSGFTGNLTARVIGVQQPEENEFLSGEMAYVEVYGPQIEFRYGESQPDMALLRRRLGAMWRE